MRTDAVLTALPVRAATPKAGRPAKRGNRLPSPAKFWEDREQTFRSCSVFVYRKDQNFRYKTFDAQWYVVTDERLLRIAIVETKGGSTPYRVLFTTDPTLDVPEVIAGYGSRWAIECFFRDAKQELGLEDSQARTENAVKRVVPFVGMLFSMLVIWFIETGHLSHYAALPIRPWYPHKNGLSFRDILRAARRATASWPILDPGNDFGNLDQ
jgi:hypothetical protein